jgi:Acetyltransferase (GNAT) domain
MGEVAEYPDAAALPERCWPADDPRRTRAWACAHRWPGDGASFLASAGRTGSVFAAVRRQRAEGGWARMDAVAVCAGRDVPRQPAMVAAARGEHADQLNLALAGYTTPVWTPDGADLAAFVDSVSAVAAGTGATPAVLHVEAGSPLLPVLAGLGWAVGVTDLYAVIAHVGTDLAGYLHALPKKKRVNVRREHRRLAEAGGHGELVVGAPLAAYHDEIAALEAAADQRHGISVPLPALRTMNERLLAAFGADMAVALVRGAGGEPVASCTLVSAAGKVLPRLVGYAEAAARPYAAYFHVAYYLPLRHAQERGATELLLGTGSLAPKLARGAHLRPLYSAVPPGSAATADLLRRTDHATREQAASLGFPVPEYEEQQPR